MSDIPPILRSAIRTLGGVGYRALSAAISTAMREASVLTQEVDRRVKRASRAAERMSRGEPYTSDDDEGEHDDG